MRLGPCLALYELCHGGARRMRRDLVYEEFEHMCVVDGHGTPQTPAPGPGPGPGQGAAAQEVACVASIWHSTHVSSATEEPLDAFVLKGEVRPSPFISPPPRSFCCRKGPR